ncbi:MAG TPA: thiamine-phosphate kinase [Dongiaceae bacterium]|nr:thiamine-phosphate kinase [Dongiaceae bacterium]
MSEPGTDKAGSSPMGSLPGEFTVIRRYFAPLAKGMPGALDLTDDACTWQPPAGEEAVLTVDALIADVHFLRTDPPDLVARKMLRVNLSDLAAKGAKPVGYLMTVAVDRAVDEAWIAAFARGLAEDQAQFDIQLMGGDTVKTPGPLSLSLTAIGTVPAGTALRRSGAQPGQSLFVTGSIGDGYLGLQVLQNRLFDLSWEHREFLATRYQLPEPRVAFGQELRRRGLATAAMDVSDGLIADLGHLAAASGCGAVLRSADVPLSEAAAELVAAEPVLILDLLAGGDDYEVLFAAAPEKREEIAALGRIYGLAVTEIGSLIAGKEVTVQDRAGESIQLTHKGYSHF